MSIPFRNIYYKRPPVTDYQRAFMDCPQRFAFIQASTKVGKTAACIIWLLEQALMGTAKDNFYWVAPVYRQAEIAFKRFKDQINDKGFFKVNNSKLYLQLPNGARIWFRSTENVDNLYGDDVKAAVFDEYSRAKEEAFFALRTTLTATKGKCKFIGNVKGRNWGYKIAMRAKTQGNTLDYAYYQITAYDAVKAGILDIEEVEAAKRDLPEHIFKQDYLAEPADDGTNPFGLENIENCITQLSLSEPVCFGIDLANKVDFTVVIGLDEYGRVCYFDRWQKTGWAATKDKILALPEVPLLIDSTGVGDPIVEDIGTARPYEGMVEGFKFNAQSKQHLIERLCMDIQSQKIFFPNNVIKDELDSFEYSYSRSGGVKYTAPEGMHDDCVISLALANLKYKQVIQNYNYTYYPLSTGTKN